MSRLLIVDDEVNIRAILRRYAELEGHEVVEAKDGLDALNKVKGKDFDIILMDIMMPELDGFSAYKEICKIKKIPAIMLSARGEEFDKLHGFELGIDDYVVKPFSPKEVMARVGAVIKRCQDPRTELGDRIEFGGLVIDFAGRDVITDGKKIKLKPKEYELLFYLVKNKNMALSRDKILNGVWGYEYYLDDRTIDAHIKAIRAGLGKYRDHIITMRGIGYKFEV